MNEYICIYDDDEMQYIPSPYEKTELIRCENCKYKRIENLVYTCPFGLPGGPSFYCGYGKRKEE